MYERMLDKTLMPSREDLCAFCGESAALYDEINRVLCQRYHTTEEIRFPYGKQYGWGITHRTGKKYICDIFAENGSFTGMLG